MFTPRIPSLKPYIEQEKKISDEIKTDQTVTNELMSEQSKNEKIIMSR